MNGARQVWTLLGCVLMTAGVWAQTPAAPAPPPTIRNSTVVPAAPVKAAQDQGTAGETPINTASEEPAADVTPAASPIAPAVRAGYFLPGTVLQIRTTAPVDSGHQRNGTRVDAVLTAPVKAANGKILPVGTPVRATVISSAAAGTMQSYGVLTLQVYRVGGVGVYSNVLEFNGQEGHKDLPDSAPAKGTEAAVNAGTLLRFHVQGAGNNPDPETRAGGSASGAGSRPAAAGNEGQGSAAPANGVTSPAPQATQPH